MKINKGNKFYMQRMKWNYDNEDSSVVVDNDSRPVDIELNYDAIYCECKGINNVGKAKNTYTESYANSKTLRVYIPKKIFREETEVDLTLYFTGDNRQDNLERFIKDISGGTNSINKDYGTPTRYYDLVRRKGFDFVYIDATTVDEDVWFGSLPYIKVTFKLKNIYGEAKKDIKIMLENYDK